MSLGACPPPPSPLASAGPAESLFKESYYQLMKTALKEDGILCCQGEGARVDWVLLGEPGSRREGSLRSPAGASAGGEPARGRAEEPSF